MAPALRHVGTTGGSYDRVGHKVEQTQQWYHRAGLPGKVLRFKGLQSVRFHLDKIFYRLTGVSIPTKPSQMLVKSIEVYVRCLLPRRVTARPGVSGQAVEAQVGLGTGSISPAASQI